MGALWGLIGLLVVCGILEVSGLKLRDIIGF